MDPQITSSKKLIIKDEIELKNGVPLRNALQRNGPSIHNYLKNIPWIFNLWSWQQKK